MPQVYSPGFDGMTTAMDYNFWVKFNGGQEEPETAPELREIVKSTYDYMYDQAYNGNRAPILIANHFNKWNGDSFNPPAMDFMKEKCGQPDTYCATYQDVIAWMELQDPGGAGGAAGAGARRRQSRLTVWTKTTARSLRKLNVNRLQFRPTSQLGGGATLITTLPIFWPVST